MQRSLAILAGHDSQGCMLHHALCVLLSKLHLAMTTNYNHFPLEEVVPKTWPGESEPCGGAAGWGGM